MKRWLFVLVLAAAFALPAVPADTEGARQGSEGARNGAKLLEGKLTGYGKNFVQVDGERIRLCKDATILDPEENPIPVGGLCATESVLITLEGSCAARVQVLILRR